MSWDSRVYLAKRRIAKQRLDESYREMQKRFGAPFVDDAEDLEATDEDVFAFARFRFRLERDAKAGLFFSITSDDVSSDERTVEEAGLCMSEWAALLGGEISEDEWNERREKAQTKKVEKRKLPKYGAADTVCYVAFDAEGIERGRKSISKDVHGHVAPKMLEPAWLVENGIVRIEYLSYGPDGTLFDHYGYVVDRKGNKQRVWEE